MESLLLLYVFLGFISLVIIICEPNDERTIHCIPYFILAIFSMIFLGIQKDAITESNCMITIGLLIFYYILGFKYSKICIEIEIDKLVSKFLEATSNAKLTSEKDYVDSARLKLYSSKKNMPYLEEKTYDGMVKQYFPTKNKIIFSHYLYATTWLFRIIWDIIFSIYSAITINFGVDKEINKILKQNPFNGNGEL